MKEIVYKIFYALATNQSERAWRKVTDKLTQPSREEILHWSQQYCAGEGSEVKHVMAFHEVASFEVLQFLLSFVEEKQSQKARQYLQENETRLFKADHSVAGMAQALLPLLGGEFAVLGEEVKERLPRYDLLSKCLAAHEKNSSERSLENATLAVRAARYGLFAGPPSIANLRCPPEVLYKDGSPRP